MKTKNETNTVNNGAKVIIYVRSSTDKQEVASQRKDLVSMAVKDGYTEEQMIFVGKAGVSAVKGGDDYHALFDEMYRAMETEKITSIYVWSVSRLIRNDDKEFFDLKAYLVRNHINLKVKTPSISLLDDNGKCNIGISIAFDIFAEFAKADIEEMREKFARGKRRNRAAGYYNGGKVRFGYKVVKSTYIGENGKAYDCKKFVKDETNADIVRRLIFDTYVNTVTSARKIADNLYKDGIINHRSSKTREMFVLEILRFRGYTGERVTVMDANGHPTTTTDADGKTIENTIQYPAIIDLETFEKAQTKLASSRKLAKEPVANKATVCYSLGLMQVKSDEAKQGYYTMQVKRCDAQMIEPVSKFTINADIADSLLLQATDKYIEQFAAMDAGSVTKDLVEKQAEKIQRAETSAKLVEEMKERLETIEKRVLRGYLRPEVAEEMEEELIAKIKAETSMQERLLVEVEELADRVTAIIDNQPETLYNLSDESRRERIIKYVDHCNVERVKNSVYTIAIHYKYTDTVDTFRIQSKKGVFEHLDGNGWQPYDLFRLNRYTLRKR